jgi:hypothetical protein
MSSKAERPALKLAPWSDQSLAELGVSLACERSGRPLRSRWHTTLVRGGVQGRPLADVSVEARTLGPVALRRTVRLETSDRSVRLELGRGLELGIGMPKWLRSARAFVQEEAVGALTIGPGLVTLAAAGGDGPGTWRFDGRLLGYVGLPDPVVYGEACWAGRRLGELLAPRLHTYHRALACRTVPLWRRVDPVLDEPARRWVLALTALVLFCVAVGHDWHDHQPGRRSD